jgi:eukaryotic-like serine/threonine-protein kinase
MAGRPGSPPWPATRSGMVYIGNVNHHVYALNAATGAKQWSFTAGAAVESSPAVANGVVYVGSDDDNVYALNAATGVSLWRFTAGLPVVSSPAVANGVVYIGGQDGNLYAFHLSGGLAQVAGPLPGSFTPTTGCNWGPGECMTKGPRL